MTFDSPYVIISHPSPDGRENLFYVVNDPAAMMAQVWLNGSLDHEDASEYLVWLDVENTNFGVGELCGSSPSEYRAALIQFTFEYTVKNGSLL